ncbi:hypothetical protein EV122DRAFT_278097 [Schizophyllum commune]
MRQDAAEISSKHPPSTPDPRPAFQRNSLILDRTFVSIAHTRATHANHRHTTPYTPNFHRGQSSAVSPSTYVLLWYPYIYFACNIFYFLRIHVNLLAPTFVSSDCFARSGLFATCEYYAPDSADSADDAPDAVDDARYPAYDARYPAYDVANSDDVAADARPHRRRRRCLHHLAY